MRFGYWLIFLLLLPGFSGMSQEVPKVPLDHSVYDNWKEIKNECISNDGAKVAYELIPGKGDGKLHVYSRHMDSTIVFDRGGNAVFSGNSDFIVFTIGPQSDTVRKLKLAKKKKTDLPKDSLGIWIFEWDSLITFSEIKSFKTTTAGQSLIAIHFEKEKKEAGGSDEKKEEKKKKKDTKVIPKLPAIKEEGSRLLLFDPIKNIKTTFESITEFQLSTYSGSCIFVKQIKDTLQRSRVYYYDAMTGTVDSIFSGNGVVTKPGIDSTGVQTAFLYSTDTTEQKKYELYYFSRGTREAIHVTDTGRLSVPSHWCPSENFQPWFSGSGKYLYFGSAPIPQTPAKDTLLEEEKVRLDIWHWNDGLIQPQQIKDLPKEEKRTYLAVYIPEQKRIIQLADTVVQDISTVLKGDGKYAMGYDDQPYSKLQTWESTHYKDIYYIEIETGVKTLLWEKHRHFASLSAGGRYALKYDVSDSSWYSYAIASKRTTPLTKSIPRNFYNEQRSTPGVPEPYGIGGWANNDTALLIYDHFDIWLVDPEGSKVPVNLTGSNSNNDSTIYVYVKINNDEVFIDLSKPLLLTFFHESTKLRGYSTVKVNDQMPPENLIQGDFSFSFPRKARDSSVIIWRKESFIEYPDIWLSDVSFRSQKRMSYCNPQQKKYLWGTVELVHWKTFAGTKQSGLLYKPENFSDTTDYPMLVYFYEDNTDNIHKHYYPKPSRSIINFTYYTSNGYLVFVPDITYGTGNPGEDAYNSVVSGVEYISKFPWVRKDRIGIQGQSWGGYQVAYLVTRTNIFRVAEAGAPVSNMTSAYGGIRWETGVSRMSQYETGQSRIGSTLWENRDLYISNSPLFQADKITTPLLIMHNDNDGAVPWYQGIELYLALRRLQKPVWMLTYNDEMHNLSKRPNCVDLTIRMQQYFDHFLKDAPEPEWLKHGIPAINKGKGNGYRLIPDDE